MQTIPGVKIFGIGIVLTSCSVVQALAQVDVRLETPKAAYLQFSPIPFTVRIKNLGAGELRLTETRGKPWLEMVVQSRDGQLIAPEKVLVPPDKTLRPGESTAIAVDLAPHYLIRDTGGYRARASVRLPTGETMLTDSLDFLIGRGEVIWSVPRGDGAERRIYSLLKFYEDPNVGLYLRVEVPGKNLVFPSRRLGAYLPLGKPVAEFDPQNNLHLLYAVAAGLHRITVVNPDGQMLREETRQEGVDKPVLRRDADGEVSVQGGIVQIPSSLRERLSTLQARIGAQAPPTDPAQP
ncbi:MAG: hypothetical protein EBQ51_02805 [Verrucomicrobia bacterium]|nr:hypothetical protein [Pseudomonadota bacterium]NBS06418.1 hypothetical protein [Verrucomicrobiota bacterium]NBS78387.1 hypothetical protein [bacterium]NBS50070.1 hypothetical protein [Verrucomicrobiota bacterium]NBT23516.1 hypothetical protein [bacterium]